MTGQQKKTKTFQGVRAKQVLLYLYTLKLFSLSSPDLLIRKTVTQYQYNIQLIIILRSILLLIATR